MNLEDLSGRIIEELYSILEGGSAEFPLPANTTINWIQPGMPFHESAFDFAIAGPFAGPTPLSLDAFKEMVKAYQGEGEEKLAISEAVEKAKSAYQGQLLGGWEQWSRLVDFIPIMNPEPKDTRVAVKTDEGKFKHIGLAYGQAGATLSDIYKDTLARCEVADEPLTDRQAKMIDKMQALLQETVEEEDFLTGEMKTVVRESRLMIAYREKQQAYEEAALEYANKLALSQTGSSAELIEWNRSGGIYRQRVQRAWRDWVGSGYKKQVEQAEYTIGHILGSNMVSWKQALLSNINAAEASMSGQFGYSFFPATVIPGGFARSDGWTKYSKSDLTQRASFSSSSREIKAKAGINLGLFSFGGSGGETKYSSQSDFSREEFKMEFEYTQVQIVRPALNLNFFKSTGWKPKDSFIRDHGPLHSDGEENPSGSMIGYPTKALFIRNLKIRSSALAREMEVAKRSMGAGVDIGYGPFNLGGSYKQGNRSQESNLEINGAEITIKGIQLIAFVSSLLGKTANPSDEVQNWV